MNIDIETVSPTRSKLLCTVTPEEFKAETDQVTREFVAKAVIPGFRKGKAPREAVDRHYGADIASDTINRVVNKYYRKAVEDKQVKVFELINIADVDRTDEGGLGFVAEVDLEPEFELPDYEGVPVDSADTATTEEKVDEDLESFRKSMSTFKDFTTESVAAENDMLNIAYAATVDGKPMAEAFPEAGVLAAREASWCTIGSKYYMIPGLTDALAGAKLGEKRTVRVVFPEDFHNEKLRGVAADYEVVVKEGRHLVVPEIDEAFLKPLNCESVEVLRERIRGHLEGAARQQDRERRFHQIVDYLVKAAPFELPAAEFERRTEEALNRLVQYGMRRGASKEELAAERDHLTSTARQQADMQIRSTMILRRIADKLDIKLDDDEFKSYLAQTFDRQRLADAQVKEIVKDRERVRALYGEAVVHKTLEALLEKAKPTDTLNA